MYLFNLKLINFKSTFNTLHTDVVGIIIYNYLKIIMMHNVFRFTIAINIKQNSFDVYNYFVRILGRYMYFKTNNMYNKCFLFVSFSINYFAKVHMIFTCLYLI